MHAERFGMNLYDYKEILGWVKQIGWTDEELKMVPVHEEATAGEEYINITNWGGTALGVTAAGGGGGSSAGVRNIHNLYIYKRDTPDHLYRRLVEISARGGPSAFEESGVFGERGWAEDFPPPAKK